MEATYNTAVDLVPEHYHSDEDGHFEVLAYLYQCWGQPEVVIDKNMRWPYTS